MNDTPETDAVAVIDGNWDTKALRMRDFARKLERERDEAKSELAFRLERNAVQQLQLSELRNQLAETIQAKKAWLDIIANADQQVAIAKRERDEAIQARKDSAADWFNQIALADLRVARIKRERDEAYVALIFCVKVTGAYQPTMPTTNVNGQTAKTYEKLMQYSINTNYERHT